MIMPNLFILYVASPPASSAFYEKLFERAPEVVLPTWAAFAFDNGLHLGLWSTHARDFASGGPGPATELSIMVKDRQEVEALYARWTGLGVEIEQPPHDAVFGRTFVACDPDGHRLRVCIPD
ncbi:glyoxalase [Chimaeribacter arupi]|uniref:VOC family protein n=1 Tax=Chimaeribacter arupi TaxID=2060066 RepID=UPI000C7C2A2C|nr:VOC family protein [Chimaeribacter arupi]PLR42700.1 glyoxalase [Chimaeribacter arupi]